MKLNETAPGEPVSLRPKRRSKLNNESGPKINVAEQPVVTKRPTSRLPRMKRSGRVQLQWRIPSELYPAEPEIPSAPTLPELVGLFLQLYLRPAHSHNSTSVSAH